VDNDSESTSPDVSREIEHSPLESSIYPRKALQRYLLNRYTNKAQDTITSSYASAPMLDLSSSLTYPLPMLLDESVSPSFTDTAFMEASPSGLNYGIEVERGQVSTLDCLSSCAGSNDEIVIQDHNSFEPVLCSPVLFASLTDKFHGILAQCMSITPASCTESSLLTYLLKMIKTFALSPLRLTVI
jgi:hypothetical protein